MAIAALSSITYAESEEDTWNLADLYPSLEEWQQAKGVLSDQIAAIQARVGVTGSAVATTIDYELHNVDHGHDHDGINSRLMIFCLYII